MTITITPFDGKAISKPGLYSGVSMAGYHQQLTDTPSGSRSQLWKLFNESPAHLWVTHYLNPDREDQEESLPLILGRGAHHLILGEADFRKHFIIRPEKYPEGATFPSLEGPEKPWSGNSKWCKAWLADKALKGLTVLTVGALESIRGMASGLHAHPMVRAGILNGLIEHTMVFKHKATGVWLKIRPDAIPTDSGDFSDFKTIEDISDEGIERAIGENGLAMQGAMTRMAARALGMEFNSFNLVFAEKKSPNCVRVKTLIDADLDIGEQSVEAAVRVYKRCIDRCVWPGPGGEQTDAEYAQMNPWARGRMERKIAKMEAGLSA